MSSENPSRFLRARAAADDPDEHVFQAYAREFDACGCDGGNNVSNRVRGFRACRKPDLATLVCELDTLDARNRFQDHEIGRGLQRLEPDRAHVVLPAQPRHRFIQYLAALMDHDDLLTELLGMRHDMSGENDGHTTPLLLGNQLLQHAYAQRIQATEGLIENEQFGLMNDRGHELHPLLHALGQVLALLVHRLGKTEPREQLRCSRLDLVAIGGLEPTHIG